MKNITLNGEALNYLHNILQNSKKRLKNFLNELKNISEGFFGPYLKILDTINFNLDIKFYSQLEMGFMFVTVTCPEINEYVRDNVLCYE